MIHRSTFVVFVIIIVVVVGFGCGVDQYSIHAWVTLSLCLGFNRAYWCFLQTCPLNSNLKLHSLYLSVNLFLHKWEDNGKEI